MSFWLTRNIHRSSYDRSSAMPDLDADTVPRLKALWGSSPGVVLLRFKQGIRLISLFVLFFQRIISSYRDK